MDVFNRMRYRYPVPVLNRPFEHVSLDLITDLPDSHGYDTVVVTVCLLTKRVIVEPTTKTITTVEDLAWIINRAVFRHFGLPKNYI